MSNDLEVAKLTALEARRCAAIAASDLDALAAVLADDYVHVLARGESVDKHSYIELIRSAPRRPTRGPLRVRVYGDAAVLTGELDNHIGASHEVPRTVVAFCTQVARKQNDEWRFVSCILTRKR